MVETLHSSGAVPDTANLYIDYNGKYRSNWQNGEWR
jgi:hypothetical protein